MAKQYIPGVSGLLTEPNPVDSPSNTLSEAENVVIDQQGKVQARHGLNVNQDEATAPFTANSSQALVASNARTFVTPIADPDNTIADSLLDYVHYSSFLNQNNTLFKLIEFRDSEQNTLSGLFVKQRKNDYKTIQTGSNLDYLFKNAATTSNVNRYYQISADSGKLIQVGQLPYDTIKNVFATNLSVYLQTEDGMAETNVDDLFDATSNKFFDIRWPAFPKISHTFIQSDIYANWLPANEKVGIQITYYREMGYSDKQEQIYESQPSSVYEIVNNGRESIPILNFDLLSIVNNEKLYEEWNQFSKLNNGRKFGIKIYRTTTVPVGQELGVEFYECYEPIRFDKALVGKFSPSQGSNPNQWFRFATPGFSSNNGDLLDINDIISYIPSFTDENGNSKSIQFNKDRVMYYSASPAIIQDMIPLRLRVTDRRQVSGIFEYQFTAINSSDNTYTPAAYLPVNTILNRRVSTRLISSGANINFLNLLTSTPGFLTYHSFAVSTIANPSTVRFIGTAPSPFLTSTDYHVVSNTTFNIQLSATIGGTAITPSPAVNDLTARDIEINPHPYIEQSYLIKSYQVELNINDSGLSSIGVALYTNPNSDSAFYTNFVAPESEFIAPFKDFYIHAGPKKPLEANISVITQPIVEQHNCIPLLSAAFYNNRSITFSTATATFTSASIGLTNGNAVYFSTVPAGETTFNANTIYYVVNAAAYAGSTFQLSATVGGAALTPSANGTATMRYQRWPAATNYFVERNGMFTKSASNLRIGLDTASKQLNGELFFESAITGPRRYQIESFPNIDPEPLPGHRGISFGYSIPDITSFSISNVANGVLNIDHGYLSENSSYNVSMFERPYLTLRLVSSQNVTNDVVIQTEPLYNRRGYYSLKNEYDEFDDSALTYDLSFDEMNAFRKSSTNLVLRRGLDNIYHVVGERSNQVSSDGVFAGFDTVSVTTLVSNADITLNRHNFVLNDTVQFVGTAPGGFVVGTTYYAQSTGANTFRLYTSPGAVGLVTPSTAGTFQLRLTTSGKLLAKWINDSTNNIYFDKDTNTILVKNMGNIDIKKFEAPGILMIQSDNTNIILFTYSSIDSSNSIANTYTFKSVALQYISRNKFPNSATIYEPSKLNEFITQNTNYFAISGPTYLFFLKGSSVDNLPIYPYAKELYLNSQVDSISIAINTTNTTIVERYTPTDLTATNPTFTLIPHRKRPTIPVGDFKRSKNYSFYGINRKDASEYLDLYAWQIINKFNSELQKNNIKATLLKGKGIGEIVITYPDGQSIQMMNGKYDSASTANIFPGKHSFLPELNKLEFIELAKKDEQNIVENNKAAISRREIPEITPVGSVITIGRPDKKMIGYAENSDDIFIFKEDGIFRLIDQGDITSNIPKVPVTQFSTNLICQASGSIQEISDEIIFLSQYGFMSISGGSVQNISGAIQRDILTLIQTSPKDRIRSFVNESKQLYYCTLINEVDATLEVKTGTYIFNTKTRQWSFMDQEILDGLEDSQKRNLVAYRQKAIVGTSNGTSSWPADSYTNRLVSCDVTFPMQTTNFVNNFYLVSRERHTDNIVANAKDQYDYVSENLIVSGSVFAEIANGFTITIPVSQNAFLFHYAQKLFKMFTPPTTINISGNQYAIVDSPIQMLSNREIFVEMLRVGATTPEYYATKLTKFEYLGTTNYQIKYTFEYLTTTIPTSPISLQGLRVLGGIPVKITFNPESGNSPDTNKLFQEYMIHTETSNRGAVVSFKTDSRSNLTTDRRFAYDATATTRNVFRTYIPTAAARGRYVIRQIKHDVPLENLIITGQTIVMRDTSSTRVQKDKD